MKRSEEMLQEIDDTYFFRTASGRLVDLNAPTLDDIIISDAAHQLSLVNRFNGATIEGRHWSVAAHSLLVAALVDDVDAYGYALGHDLAEAWVQDIVSPLKKLIEMVAGFDVIGVISEKFEAKVHEKFNLPHPVPEYLKKCVKRADILAYEIEKAMFTRADNARKDLGPIIADPTIQQILQLVGDAKASEEWFAGALLDLEARNTPSIRMIA